MIIGTAGHIDHGKSTLVKALTGVDTDRLPEERARGMSIELGYAFMPAAEGDAPDAARIGFIDVPGHEKLVHTMIAGATGIDFALLVVAADDGVMPQTREHLAVLSLLGIRRGAIVLTKIDRVDATRCATVQAEIATLVAGTSLADAPVMPVSAVSGEGVAALRSLLLDEAARQRDQAEGGVPGMPALPAGFRLAIDRVFSLEGTGTVVTGTVHAGQIRVGDGVDQAPGSMQGIRVRSLHAQNRKVPQAWAGQRCALGLAGIEHTALARGQWLVQPGLAVVNDRLDVELSVWPGEAKALRSGMPVHVHLGTTMSTASLAVLDGERLAPGGQGLVQLVLHRPLAAWHGERLVLRDAAGQRVLAGGQVLDPRAPARYRRTPQRLQLLRALCQPAATARLAGLLAASPAGVRLADWQQRLGVADLGAFDAVLAPLPHRRLAPWLAMGEDAWQQLRHAVLATLADFHEQAPDELGPDAGRLRRLNRSRIDDDAWRVVLDALLQAGDVALSGAFVHLPGHGIELAARDEALMNRLMPALKAAGAQGAWLRDMAADLGETPANLRASLSRLARGGRVCMVVKDLYQDVDTTRALAQLFRRLATVPAGAETPAGAPHGGPGREQDGAAWQAVTVAQFRDASGLGRKRAVQVLEFFDRIGLCRRVGDQHRLRPESRLFLD